MKIDFISKIINKFIASNLSSAGSKEIFDKNLYSIVTLLENLTGLKLDQKKHPLVQHLISAKKNYYSGKKRLGCAKLTFAKLALEDLQKIFTYDKSLYEHFRKELLRKSLPLQNYFGLRLELRMATSLIDAKIPFIKSETPDFILNKPINIGIECTSAHLNLLTINKPKQVIYKVVSALEKKSTYTYKTPLNILAIDISNLLHHEGQKQCTRILADMDKSRPALTKKVNESVFEALIYFYYAAIPLKNGNGVKLQSCYTRIDKDKINPDCKKFLDSKYPYGDMWVEGNLFKIV